MGTAAFTPLPPGIGLLLVQITLILVVSRALSGVLKRYFKQPGVVGEILAGVLLGKSLLGRVPGYMDSLFPASSLEGFTLMSEFGLVLYLFLVGIELQPESIVRTGKAAAVIAVSGIALPFILGVGVAWCLYRFILRDDPSTATVPFATLACFTGVGMSITAFPVLARILAETKLMHSPIGPLTLSAAAFNDAVAWVLLAIAIAMAEASSPMTAVYTLLSIVGWAIILLLCVRPALARVIEHVNATRSRSWRNALLCLVFVTIFASSYFTAFCGTDAIFGSFLVGVVLPRDEALIRVVERIEDIVLIVFLPMYFTASGLKTNVVSIGSLRSVGLLFLVLAAASVGKIAACYLGARHVAGLRRPEAFAVGSLMNARGLVELIVLNIGLRQHILNEEVFSILVLMALVTTAMTTPLLRAYYPKRVWESLVAAGAGPQHRASRLRTLSMDRSAAPAPPGAADGGAPVGRLLPGAVGGRLGILVPAHEPQRIISGLFLLLPPASPLLPPPRVVVSTFVDATSTATVLGERVGAVRDPDTREILLAARLFGAEADAQQVLAPSPDVSMQLAKMLQESAAASAVASIDFVLLPWQADKADKSTAGIAYERSMWRVLPRVDATFILFDDRGNLKLPCCSIISGGDSNGSTGGSVRYRVCVLLHDHHQQQHNQHQQQQPQPLKEGSGAVLEVAALLRGRQDVAVQVVAYQAVSPETAALLQAQKLAPAAVLAHEDELLGFFAATPTDLLVYGFEADGPPSPAPPAPEDGLGASLRARSSIGGSAGRGLRLFHHHRRGSSGHASGAAGGSATPPHAGSNAQGTRPLLQDAHRGAGRDGGGGSGSNSGHGEGVAPPPTYRALEDSHPRAALSDAAVTPRAVVHRMLSRLEAVHGKRLSLMEVHGGRAGDDAAGAIGLEERDDDDGDNTADDDGEAASLEGGGGDGGATRRLTGV